MQIDLDRKRADVMKRMDEIRDQREGLKVRVIYLLIGYRERVYLFIQQKQLKERVAKFEKFLAESHAKRTRALAKAQSEKKIREQKVIL